MPLSPRCSFSDDNNDDEDDKRSVVRAGMGATEDSKEAPPDADAKHINLKVCLICLCFDLLGHLSAV